MRITTSVHNMYPRLTCQSQVFSSLRCIGIWIPTFNDGGRVPGKPQLFKKQFNFFFYNTRAIITRSWFETTLDYKISVRTKLPSKHQINIPWLGGFRISQEDSTSNGELNFIPETLLFMSVIFHFSLLNLTFYTCLSQILNVYCISQNKFKLFLTSKNV